MSEDVTADLAALFDLRPADMPPSDFVTRLVSVVGAVRDRRAVWFFDQAAGRWVPGAVVSEDGAAVMVSMFDGGPAVPAAAWQVRPFSQDVPGVPDEFCGECQN